MGKGTKTPYGPLDLRPNADNVTRISSPKPAQSSAGRRSSDPTRGRRARSGQNRIWSEADQTGPKPTSIGYSPVQSQPDDLGQK